MAENYAISPEIRTGGYCLCGSIGSNGKNRVPFLIKRLKMSRFVIALLEDGMIQRMGSVVKVTGRLINRKTGEE
jgi:hypothetical protein